MAITNNQQIEIKWYGGLQDETAIANAINATATDGSILFVPSGSNGGALYANGHQFGLDEQSIRALVYQISQNNTGDIVQLISAIDTQLTSLSGAISNIQGQVNGVEVTGSTNINVVSSLDENNHTTFTISASGLATPGDIENAVSGLNTSLSEEISGIKTSLTGVVSDLTGAIGSVYQYSQQVSGTVNTLSGTLDNLSGAVNTLSNSTAALSALEAIEAELNNPNSSGTINSFLDTVYSIATGFLTGGGQDGNNVINIKDYVDTISGTLSSLSGSVASKIDNDTETYLVQGNDITISGSVTKNASGSYTISLAENTKNIINSASSNSNTAINALGTLTESGAVKTYIDSAISEVNIAISGANSAASDAILRWQVISNE